MKFIVIGITDNPEPWFPPEVLEIIKTGKIFSGGRRHHEIVAPLLPEGAKWIDITVPLDKVFEQYSLTLSPSPKSLTPSHSPKSLTPSPSPKERGVYSSFAGLSEYRTIYSPLPERGAGGETLGRRPIIVFASGDPLFFGFANTIKRKMPEAEITVYPTFNSLQMLAHRLVMPYHDMRIVSLTGRHWPEFDRALIERTGKIGVLTDKEHTPAAIAQRMLDYGYTNYIMYIGEHLGNPEKEKVTTLTLEEATRIAFSMPNCVILSMGIINSMEERRKGGTGQEQTPKLDDSLDKNKLRKRTFGIPDASFALLDGREKMITKMPIRLLTLQALDLPRKHVFWDIGFCTGSVSIEARLLFPHLQIEAFEIRQECEAIIHENARRFGAPGITVHIGDFLSAPLPIGEGAGMRLPDAVFIGGHGGRLKDIMAKVLTVLSPGGVIVFNSVTSPVIAQMTDRPTSRQLWDEACQKLSLRQAPPLYIQLNDHNPIEILKAYGRM